MILKRNKILGLINEGLSTGGASVNTGKRVGLALNKIIQNKPKNEIVKKLVQSKRIGDKMASRGKKNNKQKMDVKAFYSVNRNKYMSGN